MTETADPMGKLLIEIRDGAHVSALGATVRGGEPAYTDDEGRNVADKPPLVVVTTFPRTRLAPRLPVYRHQYFAKCYGKEPRLATQLALAVEADVHNLSPRVSTSRVGIFNSQMVSGGSGQIDPDTKWPFETVIISLLAGSVKLS